VFGLLNTIHLVHIQVEKICGSTLARVQFQESRDM